MQQKPICWPNKLLRVKANKNFLIKPNLLHFLYQTSTWKLSSYYLSSFIIKIIFLSENLIFLTVGRKFTKNIKWILLCHWTSSNNNFMPPSLYGSTDLLRNKVHNLYGSVAEFCFTTALLTVAHVFMSECVSVGHSACQRISIRITT